MLLRQLFIDLDETLIHSWVSEEAKPAPGGWRCFRHGEYVTILRPEAHALLSVCRAAANEVILFTFGERAYAETICRELKFGFQSDQILSLEHLLLDPKDLAPDGVLIDDRGPTDGNARIKMRALGIRPERYLQVAAFSPPDFASCEDFVRALPGRLARLASRP